MIRTFSLAAACLAIAGCAGAEPKPAKPAGSSADYVVTFTGMWTEKTHPLEYPKAGLVTGPHFSGLIGATHRRGFSIFKAGTPPTPGLERLSEEGKHSPLDEEIKRAIDSDAAGALFESDPIRDMAKPQTTRVTADAAHPLVSAVAMIAPSPDWFAGAADVPLMENGQWVPSKEVILYAWDSGGDDGKTYEASDADTNPKKPTAINDSPHFVENGKRVAVAKLVFAKQ